MFKRGIYQPFRFRIRALSVSFMEEVKRAGLYQDDNKIRKQVREYLTTTKYLKRYNDDNNKLRIKGTLIWMAVAASTVAGRWVFREFNRQFLLAGAEVAYHNVKYAFRPRVWEPDYEDPRVTITARALPQWLSFVDGVLSGTPDETCGDCEIKLFASVVPIVRGRELKGWNSLSLLLTILFIIIIIN